MSGASFILSSDRSLSNHQTMVFNKFSHQELLKTNANSEIYFWYYEALSLYWICDNCYELPWPITTN